MTTGQIVAFLILCSIPCGVWIWCEYRQRSTEIDNGVSATLANGLDDFDEDGTDPQMETRIVGRHRKQ